MRDVPEIVWRFDVHDSIVHSATTTGHPIHVRGAVIVPLARSIRVQLPGMPMALVWNRPVGILVQKAGDAEYVLIPVTDLTRKVQLGLLIAGLVGSILIWLGSRRLRTGEPES